MPRFVYHAYDGAGTLRRGELECESREVLLQMLARRGEFPVEVSDGILPAEPRWWEREVFGAGRLSHASLTLFTRELATLVKSDVPVDEALRVVHLQPALPARVRRLTRELISDVVGGRSLSEALAARRTAFPPIYSRLVQAGEASGSLGDVLDELASFYERSADVRAKLGTALLYPIVLLVAAILALVVILSVLLPTVVNLFAESGAELPAPVALLVGVQSAIVNNWVVVATAAGLLVAFAIAALRSDAVRMALDRGLLRLPIAGTFIMRSDTARFSRTLATLTRNGIAMPDALRITAGVLRNRVYRSAALAAGNELMRGSGLSTALAASRLFPDLCLRLIAVGEQTGQLDAMLARVADIFEAALQTQVQRATTLVAPLLTLFIGAIVGSLLLMVMTAIVSVNELALQ